ncbi:MAG: phosphatase PAP2 family protein [Gammaproteobacteria bacterium]
MKARVAAALVVAAAALSPQPAAAGATETSGEILRWAIPAAALGLAWQREDRAGLGQFAWAYAAAAGTTLVLKAAVDEERPDGGGDDAFPSGHAATAFAGAAVLQRRYGWATAWPAWLLATWTGYTRVESDEHDWGDVAGGAAVGIAAAWLFVEPAQGVKIEPAAVGGDGLGLKVSLRW